jgi:DNA-binding NarL/FixJ family response regulator
MPRSVLIVDDSELVRRGMRQFFEHLPDWRIAGEAASGTKAIEIASELKPDLILLDFSMPGLNGIEAASLLRKILPHAYITVFTVYDTSVGSRLSSAAGVNLVLSKADGWSSLSKTLSNFNRHRGAS